MRRTLFVVAAVLSAAFIFKTWNAALATESGGAEAAKALAAAEQKCKLHAKYLGADSTYTQQHVIDVGDVPGHQVRILEIHRTPTNSQPNCEGLKVVEFWDRGFSDYTSINGPASGYTTAVLENGDKLFSYWSGTAHAIENSDGSRKITYTGTYRYTGGTGQYLGIKGMGRVICLFDPGKNFNECEIDEEYWLE